MDKPNKQPTERDKRSQTKNALDALSKEKRSIGRRFKPIKAGTKPLGTSVTRTNRRRWIAERHGFKCPICLDIETSSRAWVVKPEVQCCKRCWTMILEAMGYPEIEKLIAEGVDWYKVCDIPIPSPPRPECKCRHCTIKRYRDQLTNQGE